MGEDLVHESERLVQSRVAGSASLLHTGGSGSGSTVTPSATISGLLITTPDWMSAIRWSDPEAIRTHNNHWISLPENDRNNFICVK